MTPVFIKKASGEQQIFSEDKLRRSLARSGAPENVVDGVLSRITNSLKPGMSTRTIYRQAFSLLKRHSGPAASRYSLKQALVELGPSGHPFERVVGEILRARGYEVSVAQVVPGHCVRHEIDVLAQTDDHSIMVECKFHHERGLSVDVKVALYVRARFEDLQKAWEGHVTAARQFHEAWLVTNARMTTDATEYSRCVGLKALSWDYPPGESLPVLIEQARLHPVTSLTMLSPGQKKQLVANGFILCTDLTNQALLEINVTGKKAEQVLKEREEICQPK